MDTTHPDISILVIQQILVEHLGIDPSDVIPEAYLMNPRHCGGDESKPYLGADSLDHLEIIMAFEEHYGIDISDEEAEKIKTVADIQTTLQARFSPNPVIP